MVLPPPCGQHSVGTTFPDSRIPVGSLRRSSADFRLDPLEEALTSCPGRGGSTHPACRYRCWTGPASHANRGSAHHRGSTCRARSAQRAGCRRESKLGVGVGVVSRRPATEAAGAHTASREARQSGAHRKGIHPAARCGDHSAAENSRGSGRCWSGIRGWHWRA